MKQIEEGYGFENIPDYTNVVWIRSALIRCSLIKDSELRLLLVILGLKNCEQIYISQSSLAERVGGCSVEKIKRLINGLVDIKLLEKKERRISSGKHKGRFTTNIYTLKDMDLWLKERGIYNRSNTELYKFFVQSNLINDKELRLFAVIKSFEGFDNILLSISKLIEFTALSKRTVLSTRDSLIKKELISYERRSDLFQGNVMNEYHWYDEKEWLDKQYIIEYFD